MSDRKRRGGPGRLPTDEAVLSGETDRLADVNSGPEPTHEEIARRAHQIYLQSGGGDGHEDEDWLRAETELRAERHPAGASDSTGG